MRTSFVLPLAVAVILATVGPGHGQCDKPPEHSGKSLAQWIDTLKDADDRRDYDKVDEAGRALGPDGPYAKTAIPALIDALEGDDISFRIEVIDILAEYGETAVDPLIRAMKSPTASVRMGAAGALREIRPRATKAVPALIEAIKDKDQNVRMWVAESLRRIGIPGDKATLKLVADVLKDESVEVRCDMLRGLGTRSWIDGRPPPVEAVPLMIETVKAKNKEIVRTIALATIADLGPKAKGAVPDLIEALRNKELAENRKDVVEALASIGPDARAAVPNLVELLKLDNVDLRDSVIRALGTIGPSPNVPVAEIITKVASGEAEGDRLSAIRTLASFGAVPKDAIPTLIAAIHGGEYGFHESEIAIDALAAMGSAAKDAVPGLIKALKSHKPYTKYDNAIGVVEALSKIGPNAKAAVPELMELARDGNAEELFREYAARAVIAIDPETAAKEKMETAYLNVRLGKIAQVKLEPRPALTEEKKKQIKALIAKLADIKNPDYGMAATLTGRAFAPIPGREKLGVFVLTDHGLKTSDAFCSLVALGPDALPFLLEALDDKTPTQVPLRGGGMWFPGSELEGNILNPVERRVLTRARKEDEAVLSRDEPFVRSRTLKVGDVCFVAIGQIVGRGYNAVRYIPSMMVSYNSPVESKNLRDRVRDIWMSDEPAKRLLDSLLLDYAIEDTFFNGHSLDGRGQGGNYQIEAALRLLFYFPKESAPIIAARLQALDVKAAKGDDWMKREVKNGVHAVDFIKAVSWCKDPAIQDALADIGKRTNDESIKEVLPAGKK